MAQHLSLKESLLVRCSSWIRPFRILRPSTLLGCAVVRVKVLDHAANDVHDLPVGLRVAQIERIDDAGQLEQVLDTLLVSLRLDVALLVHQDVKADLLDQVAMLLDRNAFREPLGLVPPLAIHRRATIQQTLNVVAGACHILFLLNVIFHIVVGQYA